MCGTKKELDKYLNEDLDDDDDFNILDWWKVNSHRFSILSQLARDVLAILYPLLLLNLFLALMDVCLMPMRVL